MQKRYQIRFFLLLLTTPVWLLSAEPYYYSGGQKIVLEPLLGTREAAPSAEDGIRWYRTPNGAKIGVKPEVIIGCDDFTRCKPLLEGYPIRKLEKLSDTLWLLTLEQGSDPFEIANTLYQAPEVKLAHPNFIRPRQQR